MNPLDLPDPIRRIGEQDRLEEDFRQGQQQRKDREMRDWAELRDDIKGIREDVRAIRRLLERTVNRQTAARSEEA